MIRKSNEKKYPVMLDDAELRGQRNEARFQERSKMAANRTFRGGFVGDGISSITCMYQVILRVVGRTGSGSVGGGTGCRRMEGATSFAGL